MRQLLAQSPAHDEDRSRNSHFTQVNCFFDNCHADVICEGGDEGRDAVDAVTVGVGFEDDEDFGWRNARADVLEVLL